MLHYTLQVNDKTCNYIAISNHVGARIMIMIEVYALLGM